MLFDHGMDVSDVIRAACRCFESSTLKVIMFAKMHDEKDQFDDLPDDDCAQKELDIMKLIVDYTSPFFAKKSVNPHRSK